ncbi:antA/AntB antirepressor family protein [Acidithiobacillus sp. MC6.1]|nr:antA/AntB antirepressor family protein [Acidithiobacillus sp. MC6.1]
MTSAKPLIPIEQTVLDNSAVLSTVNARELHAFLEVGKDFSNWIKDRINQYDFIENQDFIVCSPDLASKQGRGGHNAKEYHLTLDMAKEISMVERNAKGKEARQYFITCERRAKAAAIGHEESPELRELENTVQRVTRVNRLYREALESAKNSGLNIIEAITAAEEELQLLGIDVNEFHNIENYKRLARKNLMAQELAQEKRDVSLASKKGGRAARKPESDVHWSNYETREYLTVEDIAQVISQKTGQTHGARELEYALFNLGLQNMDYMLGVSLTSKGRKYACILEKIAWGDHFIEKYAWIPETVREIEGYVEMTRLGLQLHSPFNPHTR